MLYTYISQVMRQVIRVLRAVPDASAFADATQLCAVSYERGTPVPQGYLARVVWYRGTSLKRNRPPSRICVRGRDTAVWCGTGVPRS
jgi:hypothetical protein